jgi:replicative DNA helicase
VVIVDYLQIVAPENEKMTDKQNIDKNVLELKRICRDYQVPIIIINSFNRTNYLQEASFESFKESGAIEYSCDVLIALQLGIDGREKWTDKTTINVKRQAINEAKLKNPRDIEVIILKNRGYKAYDKIDFKYYPQFDFFEEGEKPDSVEPSKMFNKKNVNKDMTHQRKRSKLEQDFGKNVLKEK